MTRRLRMVAPVGLALLASAPGFTRADMLAYLQENLVSDIPGLAPNTDPNLKNPWGLSRGPATPSGSRTR